jgi:hypothetical protein
MLNMHAAFSFVAPEMEAARRIRRWRYTLRKFWPLWKATQYFRLRSVFLLSGGFHLINTPESIKIIGCSLRNILDAPEMHCRDARVKSPSPGTWVIKPPDGLHASKLGEGLGVSCTVNGFLQVAVKARGSSAGYVDGRSSLD